MAKPIEFKPPVVDFKADLQAAWRRLLMNTPRRC